MSTILPKHLMSEEDIKLQYITPAITAKWDIHKITTEQQIIRLVDWDKMISQPFAKYAISYLLNCQNEKLPKETVISFEE